MADGDAAMVYEEAKGAMEKSVRGLRLELQKVRTGRASTALLDGIHQRLALRALQPVRLLLPCEVPDDPADRVDGAHAPRGVRGTDAFEPAHPLGARETELGHERMRRHGLRSSRAAASSTGGGVTASLYMASRS